VKDFLLYTLARLGLFAASFALIGGVWWLVTGSVNPVVTLLLAAVVSAVGSYYLLSGLRARFAAHVDARARRAAERFEAARSKEDVD